MLPNHCPMYLPSGYTGDLLGLCSRHWPNCPDCGERRKGGQPADTSQFYTEMQVGKYLYMFFWPRCCVTLRRSLKNTQSIVCSFHFVVCNYCILKKEIACLSSLLISFFSFELQVSGKLRDHYCYLVAPIFHQI